MTDREVMQQALEAFHEYHETDRGWGRLCETMKNIRARLAEPEPEPVAWMYVNSDGECEQIEYETPPDDPSVTPLYAYPPARRPLTDEEIINAVHDADLDWAKGWTLDETHGNRFATLARAIERKITGGNDE